jgi:UDP-glucose 4-epimerase
MNCVLVTGGLGYIGSHTVVELLEGGKEVIILDDLSNSRLEIYGQIEKISGKRPVLFQNDLKEPGLLERILAKHPQIDGIIHFAAFKAVGESVEDPLKYYDNNLVGLIRVLEFIRKHPEIGLVFSSSCTVYGEAEVQPVTERHPVVPAMSPYGNTKQIGEEIIKESAEAYGLSAISLRYFNPIGAHHTALIGELPLGPPQNLIPVITQTAIGKRSGMKVFGNNYPTRDGTCIRDFIHVSDLAQAHIKALEWMERNPSTYNWVNVGTGTGSTVLEVIEGFEQVSDIKISFEIVDRRQGDVTAAWADTTKSEDMLGWKAERKLEESLRSAWEWEKYIKEQNWS